MKRNLLFLLLVVSVTASAQQLRFGVVGGVDISTPSKYFDSRVGFHAGGKMEMDASFIGKGVFFDASLAMTQKPMKTTWALANYGDGYEETDIDLWGSQTLTPTYLQLNLHAGYKFSVGSGINLFVRGGPYAALGLFGNNTIKWQAFDGSRGTEKEGVFKNTLNRFDWGLGVSVGTNFLNHYQISIGHDWGLKSIGKGSGNSPKHRTFNFSFAYMF